jgi:ABC-type oligopeptide transport system substrate-binding subunit
MGFFGFLRADSAANASGYANEAFEAALNRARDARSDDARLRELSQAESIIEGDQAVLPLYELVSRRLVARRVQGWRDDNRTALRPARWMSVTGATSTP